MMQIDNKFDVGQEVYVIQKCRVKEKCSACNGEGNKIIDGYKFTCNLCAGFGFLNPRKKKQYQVVGLNTVNL